jgi:hypothetical protein
VQTRLATVTVGAGRSNTPNHITGARNYHSQQSCPPPLPPYPSTHGAAGGGRSYDAQSHSSSGSGSAVAPLTPTGMTGGHHVQVSRVMTKPNLHKKNCPVSNGISIYQWHMSNANYA